MKQRANASGQGGYFEKMKNYKKKDLTKISVCDRMVFRREGVYSAGILFIPNSTFEKGGERASGSKFFARMKIPGYILWWKGGENT
jgi:hypothetical protein